MSVAQTQVANGNERWSYLCPLRPPGLDARVRGEGGAAEPRPRGAHRLPRRERAARRRSRGVALAAAQQAVAAHALLDDAVQPGLAAGGADADGAVAAGHAGRRRFRRLAQLHGLARVDAPREPRVHLSRHLAAAAPHAGPVGPGLGRALPEAGSVGAAADGAAAHHAARAARGRARPQPRRRWRRPSRQQQQRKAAGGRRGSLTGPWRGGGRRRRAAAGRRARR